MIKSRFAVAAVLFAVAGAANAEFSITPALTTDYDFRGISQTDESETIQLGLDFAMESGFHVGAWASEVDFGPASDAVWEFDLIAGFGGGDANESFAWDVGAVGYFYPSAKTETDFYEIYGSLSKGWVTGKLFYSPDIRNDDAIYTELNTAIPLQDTLTLGVHVGYSFGDFWDGAEHLDYSIGLDKKLGNFNVNLKYVNSNDLDGPAGRNAIIGTISTSLPWGAE